MFCSAYVMSALALKLNVFDAHSFACTIPLLMQHWVVQVRHKSFALYVILELLLEVWFQAEVLQSLPNFPLNFRLAVSVMVLAHWLYWISGLISFFGPKVRDVRIVGVRRSILVPFWPEGPGGPRRPRNGQEDQKGQKDPPSPSDQKGPPGPSGPFGPKGRPGTDIELDETLPGVHQTIIEVDEGVCEFDEFDDIMPDSFPGVREFENVCVEIIV